MTRNFLIVDVWMFLQITLGFSISSAAGWILIESLRRVNRKNKDPQLNTKKLASYSFLTPIAVYVLLQMGFIHGFINKNIVDSCTFGIVVGILVKLSQKPKSGQNVKLTVKELAGRQADIWIDSVDTPIGQVRQKIADAFGVQFPSHVLMESGRGTVIGDVSVPLSTLISESSTAIDFFGYTSTSCYITILETTSHNENNNNSLESEINSPYAAKSANNSFLSLLNVKEKACFGDLLLLSAKIPNAGTDRSSFSVCNIDKFAAAAPFTAQIAAHNPIRLISWSLCSESRDKDKGSDSGAGANGNGGGGGSSLQSSSSQHNREDSMKPSWMKHFPLPALPGIQQSSGLKIKNGDTVVIECDGKFLSVTRGWWMAWTSLCPRRSGAFTVEIVERAPQNRFTEQLKESFGSLGAKIAARRPSMLVKQQTIITQDNIAQLAQNSLIMTSNMHSMPSPSAATVSQTMAQAPGQAAGTVLTVPIGSQGQGGQDDILYTGDSFRLRSVKFPGYELGITHVKLRDEYCYVGLRKINDRSSGSEWCAGVTFSLKFNTIVMK